MVAEWTGVAVALDSFCKDDLVEFICRDTGLCVRSANLKYLSSELIS